MKEAVEIMAAAEEPCRLVLEWIVKMSNMAMVVMMVYLMIQGDPKRLWVVNFV